MTLDTQVPDDVQLGWDEDNPVIPRRPIEDDAEMDITPMIDITFLLLIFFLVASRMENQAAVDLPKAQYGNAVTQRNAVVLTVGVGTGENARIYKEQGTIEGNLLTSTNLEDQAKEIAAYVREELMGDEPKSEVLLFAEKGVKHREVARVARAIGTVDEFHANNVRLHVAVMEQQAREN